MRALELTQILGQPCEFQVQVAAGGGPPRSPTPDLSSSPAPPVEAVLGGRQSPVGYSAEHDVLGCG